MGSHQWSPKNKTFPKLISQNHQHEAKEEQKVRNKSSLEKKSLLLKTFYSATYKSKTEEFKKLFHGRIPESERLLADYSCGLQKDVIILGRLYLTQNWLCFHANIFKWETHVVVKIQDIKSVRKEKTVRVVPTAIKVSTEGEKWLFTSFRNRDKSFIMIFRIWQNALLDQPMLPQELWYWIHQAYGEDLGLTSEDEDYVDPSANIQLPPTWRKDPKFKKRIKKKFAVTRVSWSSGVDQIGIESRRSSTGEETTDSSLNIHALRKAKSVPSVLIETTREQTKGTSKSRHNSNDSNNNIDRASDSNSQTSRNTKDGKSHKARILEDDRESSGSESDESGDEPDGPSFCGCNSHDGYIMIDKDYEISIDQVFENVFTDSPWSKDFNNARRVSNFVEQPWWQGEDGKEIRTINYLLPIKTTLGDKIASTSDQQALTEKVVGKLYKISSSVQNGGVPYGDTFAIESRFCITRINDSRCHMIARWYVAYMKNPFGFVKSLIEKNALSGMKDHYALLDKKLMEFADGKLSSAEDISPIVPAAPETSPKLNSSAPLQRIPTSGSPTIYTPSNEQNINTILWMSPDVFLKAVLAVLVVLVLLNLNLYRQIRAYEQVLKSREVYNNFFNHDTTEGKQITFVDHWADLFKQQKDMHTNEMNKIKDIVKLNVKVVEQMQNTLLELRQHVVGISSEDTSDDNPESIFERDFERSHNVDDAVNS